MSALGTVQNFLEYHTQSQRGFSSGERSDIGVQKDKKYYLVRVKGSHIRHVGLISGGLSSQEPLYTKKALYICEFEQSMI